MSTSEFVLLVDRARNGAVPGRGYGVFEDVTCPGCSRKRNVTSKVGVKGFTCPDCGYHDPDYLWLDETISEGATLCPVGWKRAKIYFE